MWIAAIGRKVAWQPTVHTWLCNAHFIGCKNDDPLSPDYIPSLFTHTRSPIKRKKTAESVERYERSAECTRRKQAKTDRNTAAETLLELVDEGNGSRYCEPHSGTCTMTDLTKEDIESTVKKLESERVRSEMLAIEITEEHSKLQNDFEILQKENYELKKTLRTTSINCTGSEQCYTEDSLQDQDEKVKYLTGLPRFSYLIQMFHLSVSTTTHRE